MAGLHAIFKKWIRVELSVQCKIFSPCFYRFSIVFKVKSVGVLLWILARDDCDVRRCRRLGDVYPGVQHMFRSAFGNLMAILEGGASFTAGPRHGGQCSYHLLIHPDPSSRLRASSRIAVDNGTLGCNKMVWRSENGCPPVPRDEATDPIIQC